tara:strand:+ start:1282 stop:1575 length:294 start_codon:yes stop_codon:yes gene_type:complete
MDRSFKDKYVKDIKTDDVNVSVSGVIVNKEEDSIVLDDGTGQIFISNINTEINSDFLRVFGRVLNLDNEIRLQGFFIQDLSKIDKLLYKKVKDMINE